MSPGSRPVATTSCATSRSTGCTSRTARRPTRSSRALIEAAREAGALGACLSGAGSTILAFADSMAGITRIEAAFGAAAADVDLPGRVEVVEPRTQGARVVTGP